VIRESCRCVMEDPGVQLSVLRQVRAGTLDLEIPRLWVRLAEAGLRLLPAFRAALFDTGMSR
jgi:hypothetical protein